MKSEKLNYVYIISKCTDWFKCSTGQFDIYTELEQISPQIFDALLTITDKTTR